MQSTKSPNDLYQQITNDLIHRIESGKLTCWQPWRTVIEPDGTRISQPVNFVTKRPYTGVNVYLLGGTPFRLPYFLTFNQVKGVGATVRKGAKSLPVIYWQLLDHREEDKKIPFLRQYRVFNVEDTTISVEARPAPVPPPLPVATRLPAADAVLTAMPNAPQIEHAAGLGCFYRPFFDIVSMEPLPVFAGPEFYYGVLFHEFVHATGHPCRLNRRDKNGGPHPFGTKAYGVEELTAELGAAYLCQQVGIANERLTENQAGYLQNWLEALRSDKRLFFDAARNAQRAAEYIVGRSDVGAAEATPFPALAA
jgi:antirestriction protein ArdC